MTTVNVFVGHIFVTLPHAPITWQLPATLAIAILTLLAIMLRPKNISEAVSAGIGACLVVVLGLVKWHVAANLLLESWDVLLFFLGMMIIAAVAESAGFFNWAAAQAARYAGATAAASS